MDGELHRDARPGRPRCVSSLRSRPAPRVRNNIGPQVRTIGGSLAALAILRGPSSLGIASPERGIMDMLLHYDEFESPVGRILFASGQDAVCALDFEEYRERMN